MMIMHLRMQTPTERAERLLDIDEADLGDYAQRWRDELGFPADWPADSRYVCAVGPEPVHEDYWASLADTQASLRHAQGIAHTLEQQLAQARAQAEEQALLLRQQAVRIQDLLDGRDVLAELRRLADDLRDRL